MTRKNAKMLEFLLSIVSRSNNHERHLFKSEVCGIKKVISYEDYNHIDNMINSLMLLKLDLDEALENVEIEKPYPMADDCFDRFGY